MRKQPDWIPDWQDKSNYPDIETTTLQQWAWEFLRRSPCYQQDYSEFERKIEPDILRQVKDGFITNETAQRFIQCLNDHGKDSLMLKLDFPANLMAGGYEGEREYRMWLPWFLDDIPGRDTMSMDEIIDNWNKIIPEIRESVSARYIREFSYIYSPKNPTSETPPKFTDEVTSSPFVPVAVPHTLSYLNFPQPETEHKIAFMVDLKRPINNQIAFIKNLSMELKVKTKGREKKNPKIEWQKQLRLLDAIDYGTSNAKEQLAKEWDCSVGNINIKYRNATTNMHVGYRRIILHREATLNGDAGDVARQIQFQQALSKIELNFDKDIDPNIRRREAEKIKQEGLKRLKAKSEKQ